MQILIVGASGFVGSALRSVYGPDAVGTYCNHPTPGLRYLDVRDAGAVDQLLSEVRPDLVIHPAAQPNVDWCEDHVAESHAINVEGTRNVAAAARAHGARYVFFSTDYVFNGGADRTAKMRRRTRSTCTDGTSWRPSASLPTCSRTI